MRRGRKTPPQLFRNMKYYPLFMGLEGQKCLVVGAGSVAERKVRTLMGCGAVVTVVGENPTRGIQDLEAGGLTLRPRKFRRSDMGRYALVIGATDDREVNRTVSRESRRRGLPVNIADDPELSTFILPAVYHRGDLTIAVSTAGRSPAAARAIKEDLGRNYGRDYAELIDILGSHRGKMMDAVDGHRRRTGIWRKIIGADILGLLRRKGRKAAAGAIAEQIEQAAGKGTEK